jgi:hypothetical protein
MRMFTASVIPATFLSDLDPPVRAMLAVAG